MTGPLVTEAEVDAGARAMYADIKIPGRKMPRYEDLTDLSRARYRRWARLVLDAGAAARAGRFAPPARTG